LHTCASLFLFVLNFKANKSTILKRITIKDIARELNMHHSTVSRALRNDLSVKIETREKVAKFAQDNGYQINMSALQLRGSVKNTIAVLVPNISHNFFSNIVSIITNLAYGKGYMVSVFQSNENYEQEKEIINTLIRNDVAGVIASISMETTNSSHFKLLEKYKIPLVFFDRVCMDVAASKVTVNNIEALTNAIDLLVQKGYRRIAHLTGKNQMNVFRERQWGYLEGLRKNGLSYNRSVEIGKNFVIEDGIEATEMLLNENPAPDAIICDSHFLTLGVIFKLREKNIQIPQDFGVAGFGDNPYVRVTSSEIISIVQPDESIAEAAFELLLKKIENGDDETVENRTFSTKIIEPR